MVLQTTQSSIRFNTPIILASGTAAYGSEIDSFGGMESVGAISLKALSVKKREGNPPPRICECSSSIMNAIGLANEGIDYFEKNIVPSLSKLNTRIIANVVGGSIEEYASICERLNIDEIDAIELNVSCPNVHAGGRVFGEDIETLKQLTDACLQKTKKPLIIKLPPILFGIEKYASACEEAGASFVSLINTIPALDIDIKTHSPRLGNNFGGLSGQAILPVALRLVYLVSKAVSIPIIGGGGITNGKDAFKFLLAGASLISVGTAVMKEPKVASKIAEELEILLKEKGFSSVEEAVGKICLNEAGK